MARVKCKRQSDKLNPWEVSSLARRILAECEKGADRSVQSRRFTGKSATPLATPPDLLDVVF